MFLSYLFILVAILFILILSGVLFTLLRNWLYRWPIAWQYFYKYTFLCLFLLVLLSTYYNNYLGTFDLAFIFSIIVIYYKSSLVRLVFAFFFYFLGRFFKFWWNKLKMYNYRYYYFSLNIVFTESDLFWLEVHRDQLYPNDDRYFRIYRRWVFWMSPRLLDEESNDYFYLFVLGYLARQFTIMLRLGFIYGRIYIQRLVSSLCGTTFSHVLFFSVYFVFLYSIKKISYTFHKIGWLIYINLLRQFQYIGSNYINFHILDELNMSWAQSEIPGNYDAFDEVIYGYPKDPTSFIVKGFEYFKSWDRLAEQNGLNSWVLAYFRTHYFKYFFSLILFMPLLVFFNILGMFLFHLAFSYGRSLVFFRFMLNNIIKSKLSMLRLVRLNSRFYFFLLALANACYYILLVPLMVLRNHVSSNYVGFFIHALNCLYYSLVLVISFISHTPALLFYLLRGILRMVFVLRLLIMVILLIVIFSDQQLYFIYIFSFGWVFNIVFSHLDSLHLFRPEEYISLRISYRYVASAIPTYPFEFFKTLYYYKIYVWQKISDVYRVRSAWYTMTKKWTVWIFFMRFMPFYGQTSMIQKWWYNAVYYFLLRTPVLFWWTYASYDSFYGAMWVIAGLLKIFLFLPHSLLRGFFFSVDAGSATVYKSGRYLLTFIASFLGIINNYIIWPIYIVIRYFYELLASAFLFLRGFLLRLTSGLLNFLWRNIFKMSWAYLLSIYLSLDDSFFWKSYAWLVCMIYGDLLYYLPKIGSVGFLKLSFLLELAETYRVERLCEFYYFVEKNLWKLASVYWSFLDEARKSAMVSNPMFFFLATMLEAQRYLDILSINLQFPRDVHKNVYDYIVKKNLNFRFLRWIFPMRRTEMYSTAKWYMPIMTYFSLMSYVSSYGEGLGDNIGFETLVLIRKWLPSFFFGFLWNTIVIYYFLLILLVVVFPGFFFLTFSQGPVGDHINREYNWYRFLNQESPKLAWLFPDIKRAPSFAEHTEITNKLDIKLIYYEKLLARTMANNSDAIKYSIDDLMDDSFVEIVHGKEEFNFIAPEFLDFYLTQQYPSFRSAIHKGDQKFVYFSALAYGRDEWVRTLWERTDDDDYNPIGPEVLFDQTNLDAYISFFDRFSYIQRRTDAYLFGNNLGSWTLSKDPYSFSIIRTSIKEEFMDDKWAQYFNKLTDEYEFEDDSDVTYISWSLWAWLLAIPAMLFYQAFFFLGGSHWHYNRFSSGIIHTYMLYLNAALNHFEIAKLVVDISGDSYPNVKREASYIGNHQMSQYKPNSPYSVLRMCFYEYKLPPESIFGENEHWFLSRLFCYRGEYLALSSLDSLRLTNIFSFLLLLIFFPWILTHRWNAMTKKTADLFKLNNHVFLQKWSAVKVNLKRIYLWFYR